MNLLDIDGTLLGGRDAATEVISVAPSGAITSTSAALPVRTLTKVPGSTVLGSNPLLALSEAACPSQAAWNGAACPGRRFVTAFISDISTDAGHNALGPLEITRQTDPADNSTWRTTVSRATIDDHCPIVMRSSNYMAMITPGSRTDLFWPATEPNQWRFQWLSKNASDAAVVSLFIQRPNAWELWVSDVGVAPYKMPMMQVRND